MKSPGHPAEVCGIIPSVMRLGAGAPRATDARRRWAVAYLGLAVVYVLGGMLGRWSGWQNGDQLWFVDAARHILAGSWRIYDFRPAFTVGVAPPSGVPYSYSPLLALVLAPFVALADALGPGPLGAAVGGADQLAYRLIALPLLVADVLALYEFRRLARAWAPAVDETALFLGTLVLLGLASFFVVSASQNHHEGLVLWLILLTLRATPRHTLAGGLLAGLALAAKQTAALALLPVGGVLLLGALGVAGGSRRPRALVAWAGAAAGVFAAFLLPPLLAEPDAVVDALVRLPGRLVLFGPGLPGWIDAGLRGLLGPDSAAYAGWHAGLIAGSNAVLVGATALAVGGALLWNARRGRPIGLRDSRLLALVAVGALLQIVLGKWVASHYYALPLALLLLWDTVRSAPRWPALGLGAVLGLRAITVALPVPGIDIPRGAFLLLLCALAAALAWSAACAAPPPEEAPA